MESLYSDIAAKLDKLIPKEWSEIYLYKDTGEFDMDYSYNDISTVDPFEQQIIWRFEVLDLDSSNQSNLAKKILEKYIANKKKVRG